MRMSFRVTLFWLMMTLFIFLIVACGGGQTLPEIATEPATEETIPTPEEAAADPTTEATSIPEPSAVSTTEAASTTELSTIEPPTPESEAVSTEESPTEVLPPQTTVSALADELEATAVAQLEPTSTPDEYDITSGISEVNIFPLEMDEGEDPLWVLHSEGMRRFDPPQNHFVAIYRREDSEWQEVDRLELGQEESEPEIETDSEGIEEIYATGPDFIFEEAIRQVELEPTNIWLVAEGGLGAHSLIFNLLRFDGEELMVEISHFTDGSSTGQLRDVNNDGTAELILDMGTSYVFCYACGVHYYNYQILQWDGSSLTSVELAEISDNVPEAELNNQAVTLAQGHLWKQAQELITQAQEVAEDNPTVVWNAAIIDLHAEANAQQVEEGPYPLLANIFYGDYEAVMEIMQPYSPEEIFSLTSPLIVETSAQDWEETLAQWIMDETNLAIKAQPDLAAAYFLRGWATYLIQPDSPKVFADVQEAAELNPDNTLFTQSADYLE